MLEIHRKMDTAADFINQIEWIRKQIYDLKFLRMAREVMGIVLWNQVLCEVKLSL